MAQCRCGDINRLNEKINRLNDAIELINSGNGELESCETSNEEVVNCTKDILGTEKYSMKIKRIPNDLRNTAEAIVGAIDRTKSSLEYERSMCQAEDFSYHEEERRKEEEKNTK